MAHFIRRCVLSIILFSFMILPHASRAQDQQPDPALQEKVRRALTSEEFSEALPGKAEELYMDGFLALKEKGPVVVLDVRSKDSFARRHLKGSVNAPLTDLTEDNLPALVPDKDTPVVLACDYSFAPVRMIAMTMQAYPVLKANGYKNIYRLNLWTNKGGGEMYGEAEQEKQLDFEGSGVLHKD